MSIEYWAPINIGYRLSETSEERRIRIEHEVQKRKDYIKRLAAETIDSRVSQITNQITNDKRIENKIFQTLKKSNELEILSIDSSVFKYYKAIQLLVSEILNDIDCLEVSKKEILNESTETNSKLIIKYLLL